MDIKKLVLTSAIAMGALTGYAQQAGEVVEYDFQPHAYIQLQPLGLQETVGEGSFGDLSSYNLQGAVGYQWNPLFGARAAFGGWKSKGVLGENKWGWSYLSAMLDFTFNLTNAVGGYNPERIFDVNLIAGAGVNHHWANGPARKINEANGGNYLKNLWTGNPTSFAGRVGMGLDFNFFRNSTSDFLRNLKVGLELTLNATNDKYNSKVGSNCDFYWNGLIGVKYSFGETYQKRVVPVVAPVQEIIRETIYRDTVIVQQPAPQQSFANNNTSIVAPAETFERNVFFKINQAIIRPAEMVKVEEIANYMKAHPSSRVHITGYADKGTGTLAINLRLARERANVVVKTLINKYGINGDRITSSSMTDTLFQPFEVPEQNRVAICVVE